jgi:hypothetical protein
MLSRMLCVHPDVLSLGEFWNCFLDRDSRIPTHEMSGEEFWRRIATPAPAYDELVNAGIKRDDAIKPTFPTRFDYDTTGMPPIIRVMSQMVENPEPDPLYDELDPEVSSWPQRPLADHVRAFFVYLARNLGRSAVVERTGASLGYFALLREQFPEARFVFLHRGGPDTALSMSRYPTLRLLALRVIAAAVASSVPSSSYKWPTEITEILDSMSQSDLQGLLETLPVEIRAMRPEDFTGLIAPPYDKGRFLAFQIPISYFGSMWSSLTRTGTREIREVPRGQWTTMRYERLLKDTEAELTRLAGFIGVPAEARWLERCREFADPGRSGSAAAQLHPADLAALRAVCAAGSRAFDRLEEECAKTEQSRRSGDYVNTNPRRTL